MEGDEIDPFSSFEIQASTHFSPQVASSYVSSENQNYVVRNVEVETSDHRRDARVHKLEPRRKEKRSIGDSSISSSLRGYKLKVKYDGYFKPIYNGTKQKYCLGRQRTLYLNPISYQFCELMEEVSRIYHWEETFTPALCFMNKNSDYQSFVKLKDDESYQMMLQMYKEEKEVVVYVTTEESSIICDSQKENLGVHDDDDTLLENTENEKEPHQNYEEESDYCLSEESYHSLYSTDDNEHNLSSSDDEPDIGPGYEGEFYSYDKDKPVMEVGAQYPHATAFRRALNHYAITHDFEYEPEKSDRTRVTARCSKKDCCWRVHASVVEDGITFAVKTLQPNHTCSGVNKSGNRHATKGWIAERIIDDLRSEGDTPVRVLKKKLERQFGIQLPYLRVWNGKELAMEEIYGKWDDSFKQIGAFKEILMSTNYGSVVEFETEPVNINGKRVKKIESIGQCRHFQRFFVALKACTAGFLVGCRPYIGIDACHLKGKWKGVLAAATAVDGNNWMFPVAFAVMENESEQSWEWFLRSLYQAIGMPDGLVISSDMQKGLVQAVEKVYPFAEHRECMRHLFSNFKKHFGGDLFKFGLWAAARTYSPIRFQSIMTEISKSCPAALTYLEEQHSKLWSRSQFGTASKCDYLTNNISETFNAWVSEARHKPVLDLLNSIRRKIMVRFNERRRIVKNWKSTLVPKVDEYTRNISRGLGAYEVHRSTDFCAEVECKGRIWNVNLKEKICTCRAWQVKGIPCVHSAAFIASIRNAKWEDYVDPYFTVARFKETYALPVVTIPSRDEWMETDLGYKMLPPIMNRPSGRPRKNRMKPSGEKKRKKKSSKCSRCGLSGHHKNTCKNAVFVDNSDGISQDGPMTEESTKTRGKKKAKPRSKKMACTTSLFRLLEEENY